MVSSSGDSIGRGVALEIGSLIGRLEDQLIRGSMGFRPVGRSLGISIWKTVLVTGLVLVASPSGYNQRIVEI